MTNDRALKRFWGFAFTAAWGTGLVVLLAGSGPGCKKGGEEPAAEAGVTLMGNAVKGGLNTQVAEWYEEILPQLQQELGFPVRYISAGIPDQDFKARAALDIKSGKGPDIMDLDQFWIPEFAEAGFLLPLDPYIADWPDRTQSYEGVQRMGQYRGHTYMVVWNADLRLLFYHRPILEQAGIKLPWQPQSWEDLIAAARQIQAKVPGVTPLQIDAGVEMGEAATMQGFYMVLLGAGGNLYNYEDHQWIGESPALRKAVGFYHRIYRVDKLADAQLQVSAKARDKSFERFQKGRIAIYLEGTWFYTSVLDPKGPWGIPDRDQRIGWAYMPKEKPAAPGAPNWVTISGGDGLVINPNCRQPERAWKVVAALNALSRQTGLFQRKPFTPTRRDLAALPEVKKNRFIAETAEALMPITTSRPGLAEYQEISFQVQLLTERVATGQMTVEQGLGEYEKALQAVARDKMIKNPDHP